MRVRLRIVAGPKRGNVVDLGDGETLIVGRGTQGTGVRLDDGEVSRNHCVFEAVPPRLRVRDLGSRNGTFVNDVRKDEAELHDGDRVRVGATVFTVELPKPAQAGRPGALRCARCGLEVNAQSAFAAKASDSQNEDEVICTACREELADSPEVVPGHKLTKKLGQGGMGTVWQAVHLETGQQRAIKVLRPEIAQKPIAIRMFLREGMAGQTLDHPHAVKYHATGYANGVYYFVMELVEGPDLMAYLRETRRPMSLGEAWPVMEQMLQVLEHAHDKRLVHRDLKPHNILLASLPPKTKAKLTDFGLMKTFASSVQSFITRTGQGAGTPEFMAPEQVEDAKHVGPAADLYALTATFFFMMTLTTPIEFKPGSNPILALLEGKVRSLRSLNPSVWPALDEVVARALDRDPTKRYPSARELHAALAHAVSS